MNRPAHLKRKYGLNFLTRIIILLGSLIITILILVGYYFNSHYTDQLEEQMGLRALSVAQSVGQIPELRNAFFEQDPSKTIQPIAESIRKETGAEFIVVGNRDSIRYSHPLTERIGLQMVGGDNEPALLYGESYVSKAVGSLGESIRGKVPVYSNDGEIIGIVSVGFLIEDIEMTIADINETWFLVTAIMGIGLLGAIIISLHVKRIIHGLEPEEIRYLFEEKEAILQSIHEGIIAVDHQGKVTMINQNALNYLTGDVNSQTALGKDITELIENSRLHEVLKTGKSEYNQELWLGKNLVVVNRIPIKNGSEVTGAVSTFRNRTEIIELSRELSKVKQYSEALRAQTHEFSNKLNTISGLLQLNKTSEAVDFINKESNVHQKWIEFFIENVSDSMVSAVLLGKMSRVHELGIKMNINENSHLRMKMSEQQREGIITILGNLIENSYEAVLTNKNASGEINIYFTDIGKEIIFEVEDNGPGIPENLYSKIFNEGFSTKEGSIHRGIGLALVKQTTEDLKGQIVLEESPLGGACFIVSIPKHCDISDMDTKEETTCLKNTAS